MRRRDARSAEFFCCLLKESIAHVARSLFGSNAETLCLACDVTARRVKRHAALFTPIVHEQLVPVGLIAAQTVFNIGMCLMLLPVIGITLPFFSAGGSSSMCLYFGFGLVLSVYMRKHETNMQFALMR